MKVVEVLVQIALNIALTAWVVRRDMRRLTAEESSRSWNDASFWVAVVVFGPLCIPVHFTRVRRTVIGFALGVLWMLGVLGVLAVASGAFGLMLG